MTARNGKPCKKCGTSDWYEDSHCKECHRASVRKWARSNPEKKRSGLKKWYKANPGKQRVYDAKRQPVDPEKAKKKNAKWYAANREKAKANSSSWRIANPDNVKAIKNRRRTRKTKAGGSFTGAEWRKLCRQYGNRCVKYSKKAKLTADHVIPVSRGGSSNIDNIQPLCQSCNSSKGTKINDYRA